MAPLGPADQDEPVPVPASPPFAPGAPRWPGGAAQDSGRLGTLSLRIQPGDASVVIDGETWRGSQGDRLTVQLPEGTHQLRIEKPGFQPFAVDVNVVSGQTTSLNVSLNGR
jgi:hypothetical protein